MIQIKEEGGGSADDEDKSGEIIIDPWLRLQCIEKHSE